LTAADDAIQVVQAQVNLGLNPASILGIALAVAGAGLYFLRNFRPELARDHDIFFSAVGLLCGLILLSQGWRLDPILQFGVFLLAGSAGFFAWESIRLRGVATEQAKRNPIVDDERPVSRVYRAELDEYETFDERPPRRRIKGSRDVRSRDVEEGYEEEPRYPLRGDVRQQDADMRLRFQDDSEQRPRKRRPRPKPEDGSSSSQESVSGRASRVSRSRERSDYVPLDPDDDQPARPRRSRPSTETTSSQPARRRTSDRAIPGEDYADYQPVNRSTELPDDRVSNDRGNEPDILGDRYTGDRYGDGSGDGNRRKRRNSSAIDSFSDDLGDQDSPPERAETGRSIQDDEDDHRVDVER
jgi:hypothetical protein